MSIAKVTHNNILNPLLKQPCFQTTSPAKCILSGEHAVLRGHPALVIPVKSCGVTVQYWQTSDPVTFTLQGPDVMPERLPLSGFIDYLCHHLPHKIAALTGHFNIHFTSGIASGLGTSASLAVAFAQWCVWRRFINADDLFKYAHCFENFFHGTSSGVDVAAVLHQQPLLYKMGQAPALFELQWVPVMYLSSTGQSSNTKNAIAKVKLFNDNAPNDGQALDTQMAHSVDLMQQGLTSDPDKGFALLKRAFKLGFDCYQQWGLNDTVHVQQHHIDLQALGAQAFKPTGAGDGGYVLSLWNQRPVNPPFEMIALFS